MEECHKEQNLLFGTHPIGRAKATVEPWSACATWSVSAGAWGRWGLDQPGLLLALHIRRWGLGQEGNCLRPPREGSVEPGLCRLVRVEAG